MKDDNQLVIFEDKNKRVEVQINEETLLLDENSNCVKIAQVV